MAFWIGLAIFILASIVAERLLPPQYKKVYAHARDGGLNFLWLI